MIDLIADRVLTAEVAALLWAHLARRASIIVAAGPSRAGKTTLLTALLDFLPPATQRIYLRGCFEPFAFLHDPAIVPARSYLLINEMSAHLPIYLWGPAVHRALAAHAAGFAVAATAHATSAEELIARLTGYPLSLPTADLAAIDLVVLLDAWQDAAGIHRQIDRIVTLAPVAGQPAAIATTALVQRAHRAAPPEIDRAATCHLAERLRGVVDRLDTELQARDQILRGLRGQPPTTVRQALTDAASRWQAARPMG